MATVSRFISHLGKKALPLYKLMKKSDEFVWTDKADDALKDPKKVLSTAPVLAAPEDQEPMLLYMAATNRVVSIIIVGERKDEAHEYSVQRPVYYVSEVLTESKQRYPHYQKLAYKVFLALRKLRHYFYDHKITVVSKAPLKDIINNSDTPR
jgi:dsDNA-binding SOS-regulon protein